MIDHNFNYFVQINISPLSAMLRLQTSVRSGQFFSAFHRYVSTSHGAPKKKSNVIGSIPSRPLASPPNFQPFHQAVSTATAKTNESHYSNPPPPSSSTVSQPATTHYTLFPTTLPRGPPPNGPFIVDVPTLRREFLQLQARAHPDRHQGPDKARAEGTSALINEAYKTLSSPLLRAQYILHLNGIDVAEDETAKVDDPELLMEVLEAREAIEGAEEEAQIEKLKEVNEERVKESEGVVGDLCEKGLWEEAKSEAVKLKYWTNIREALHGWEKGKPIVLVH